MSRAGSSWSGAEVKVGAVVLVALALLAVCLAAVLGIRVGARDHYLLRLDNVAGLEVGSPVSYGGFRVGRVDEIRVSPEQDGTLETVLSIQREVRLPRGSVATVQAPIFGETFLEIEPGDPARGFHDPGDALQGREPFDLNSALRDAQGLIEEAATTVTDLSGNIERISLRVERVLEGLQNFVGEENQAHLGDILAETDRLLERNGPGIERSLRDLEEVAARMKEAAASARNAAARVDGLLEDNREELNDLLAASEQTLRSLERVSSNVDELLTGQRGNLEETLAGMRETSQNLVEFTRLLKERPWSLLRRTPPREEVPASRGATRTPREGVARTP